MTDTTAEIGHVTGIARNQVDVEVEDRLSGPTMRQDKCAVQHVSATVDTRPA